jgi:putative restriction endonuclease
MDAIEERLLSLKVGLSKGRPAVHKPLLVLLLLARAQRGESNRVAFQEVAKQLERAIQKFGSSVKKVNPALPFRHLQSDGFWTLTIASDSHLASTGGVRHDVVGEVDPKVWDNLLRPGAAARLGREVLAKYFAPSSAIAVAEELGLGL